MSDKAAKFKQLDRLVQTAMELGQAFERAKRKGPGQDRRWAMYFKCKGRVLEVQRELAGLEPAREVHIDEEVLGV